MIIWDVQTSRKIQKLKFEGVIYHLEWNKSINGGVLAVCNDQKLFLLNPRPLCKKNRDGIDLIFEMAQASKGEQKSLLTWTFFAKTSPKYAQGFRLEISMPQIIKFITFHVKGDYFATVSPTSSKQNEQLYIHCLSKVVS